MLSMSAVGFSTCFGVTSGHISAVRRPLLGFARMTRNFFLCVFSSSCLLCAPFGSVALSIGLRIPLESTGTCRLNTVRQSFIFEAVCRIINTVNDSRGQRKLQSDPISPSWLDRASLVSSLWSTEKRSQTNRCYSAFYNLSFLHLHAHIITSHSKNWNAAVWIIACYEKKSNFGQIIQVSTPIWANKTI